MPRLLPFALLLFAAFPVRAQTASPVEEPLTLEECRVIGFARHGSVGAARESAQAARERITSARSAQSPQLNASASTDYQNGQLSTVQIPSGAGFSSPTTTTTLSTGVTLSQNLFDAGKTRQNVRVARAQSIGQLAQLGEARDSLAFSIAQAYFEQLRQERLIDQRQRQVELAREQLAQIGAQIEAGTSARSDLTGARVTLTQAQFDLVTAQNDRRTASARLRNALGLERGPALQLAPPEQDVEAAPTLEVALRQARGTRPDLVSRRADIANAQSTLRLANIERRPQFNANLGFNLDPRESNDRRLQVGTVLSLPLFDGRSRQANARAARDELRAAQLRFAQTDQDAQTQVETALTDFSGQQSRVELARALVESAEVNLQTATERYRAEVGIALDVTSAQSQLFQAQTSLTTAEFDLQLARASIDRALGRFAWELGPPRDSVLNGTLPVGYDSTTVQEPAPATPNAAPTESAPSSPASGAIFRETPVRRPARIFAESRR